MIIFCFQWYWPRVLSQFKGDLSGYGIFIIKRRQSFVRPSGGLLNIRCRLNSIRIPMLKIRRSCDRLIFNMGIPIPGKDGLYIETGPGLYNGIPILVRHLYTEMGPMLYIISCFQQVTLHVPGLFQWKMWLETSSNFTTSSSFAISWIEFEMSFIGIS